MEKPMGAAGEEEKLTPDPDADVDTTPKEFVRNLTTMHWGSINYMVGFFSLLSLVACCTVPLTTPVEQGQVAIPAVSLAVVLIVEVLHCFDRCRNSAFRHVISIFMFLWWFAGVIFLTFFGSFKDTTNANGYFGAWFGFIFSCALLMSASPWVERNMTSEMSKSRQPLTYLILASCVVIGSSIDSCIPVEECLNDYGWALSLSSISGCLALLMAIFARCTPSVLMLWLARFLVLWWTVGVLTVTYIGPFKATGNGYFGSFASFVASLFVYATVSGAHKGSTEKEE